MKKAPREHFRWAPHTGGLAVIKLKDYELDGEVEAPTPYAAWKTLSNEGRNLQPGDVLELMVPDGTQGDLLIAKYIGFEPAQWYTPEPKPEIDTSPVNSQAVVA